MGRGYNNDKSLEYWDVAVIYASLKIKGTWF